MKNKKYVCMNMHPNMGITETGYVSSKNSMNGENEVNEFNEFNEFNENISSGWDSVNQIALETSRNKMIEANNQMNKIASVNKYSKNIFTKNIDSVENFTNSDGTHYEFSSADKVFSQNKKNIINNIDISGSNSFDSLYSQNKSFPSSEENIYHIPNTNAHNPYMTNHHWHNEYSTRLGSSSNLKNKSVEKYQNNEYGHFLLPPILNNKMNPINKEESIKKIANEMLPIKKKTDAMPLFTKIPNSLLFKYGNNKGLYQTANADINSNANLDTITNITTTTTTAVTATKTTTIVKKNVALNNKVKKKKIEKKKGETEKDKEKKEKKKKMGRIYKVVARGRYCWRAEWYQYDDNTSDDIQDKNANKNEDKLANVNVDCNTTTIPTTYTTTSSNNNYNNNNISSNDHNNNNISSSNNTNNDNNNNNEYCNNDNNNNSTNINTTTTNNNGRGINHANGNAKEIKKSRQFSESVYGSRNARLLSLFELIIHDSVPKYLRQEQKLYIAYLRHVFSLEKSNISIKKQMDIIKYALKFKAHDTVRLLDEHHVNMFYEIYKQKILTEKDNGSSEEDHYSFDDSDNTVETVEKKQQTQMTKSEVDSLIKEYIYAINYLQLISNIGNDKNREFFSLLPCYNLALAKSTNCCGNGCTCTQPTMHGNICNVHNEKQTKPENIFDSENQIRIKQKFDNTNVDELQSEQKNENQHEQKNEIENEIENENKNEYGMEIAHSLKHEYKNEYENGRNDKLGMEIGIEIPNGNKFINEYGNAVGHAIGNVIENATGNSINNNLANVLRNEYGNEYCNGHRGEYRSPHGLGNAYSNGHRFGYGAPDGCGNGFRNDHMFRSESDFPNKNEFINELPTICEYINEYKNKNENEKYINNNNNNNNNNSSMINVKTPSTPNVFNFNSANERAKINDYEQLYPKNNQRNYTGTYYYDKYNNNNNIMHNNNSMNTTTSATTTTTNNSNSNNNNTSNAAVDDVDKHNMYSYLLYKYILNNRL